MNNYELIILCGKAGAGKDYLLQQILKHYGNDINAIISDTTRPPRSYEQDGIDYNFLSLETFSETKLHMKSVEMKILIFGCMVRHILLLIKINLI